MIVKNRDAKKRQFRGISLDVLAVGEKPMVERMKHEADEPHPREKKGPVAPRSCGLLFALLFKTRRPAAPAHDMSSTKYCPGQGSNLHFL